jgi:hypothetical protein
MVALCRSVNCKMGQWANKVIGKWNCAVVGIGDIETVGRRELY